MLNFFKRHLVYFLTRGVYLVSNRTTQEYFIVSHISTDGYIVLLTTFNSYLPVSYSLYKKMFKPESKLPYSIAIGNVIGILGEKILLSTGETLKLSDLNESDMIEDSLDTSF
jgi:hypothetical protein